MALAAASLTAANASGRISSRVSPAAILFLNSGVTEEKLLALMFAAEDMAADVGSVIYGEEAVELGIIDQLGGLPEGLDWLYRRMDERRG